MLGRNRALPRGRTNCLHQEMPLSRRTKAGVTRCGDPGRSSGMLTGWRKETCTHTHPLEIWHRGPPRLIRGPSPGARICSQVWAGQLLPPGLLALGTEQTDDINLPLERPPGAAHARDRKKPFIAPSTRKGPGPLSGPSQVTEPGAPLVPAGNPSPAEWLSPPVA